MNKCVTKIMNGHTCGGAYANISTTTNTSLLNSDVSLVNSDASICVPNLVQDTDPSGWSTGCIDEGKHRIVHPPPESVAEKNYLGCEGWCTGNGYAWAQMSTDGTCSCADLSVHHTTTTTTTTATLDECDNVSHFKRLSPFFDQIITNGQPVCYVHLSQNCMNLPNETRTGVGWVDDSLEQFDGPLPSSEEACQERTVSFWDVHCKESHPTYFYSSGKNTLFCDNTHRVQVQNVLQNEVTTAINQSELSPTAATAAMERTKQMIRASKHAVSAAILSNTLACERILDTNTTPNPVILDNDTDSLTLMHSLHTDNAMLKNNVLIAQVNGKCMLELGNIDEDKYTCHKHGISGCEYTCNYDGLSQTIDIAQCVMGNVAKATMPNEHAIPYEIPTMDTLSSVVNIAWDENGMLVCDSADDRLYEISTCTGKANADSEWASPSSCPISLSHVNKCPSSE